MSSHPYPARLERCSRFMKEAGLDVLLLTKPANMFYLTGDGRLCAHAMITKEAKVAPGLPQRNWWAEPTLPAKGHTLLTRLFVSLTR